MIIATDHLFGALELVPGMLFEVAGKPTLILLNVVLGAAVTAIGYFASRFALRWNWLVWALGLGTVVALAWLIYVPNYPAGQYYKEAEIPAGQFAHMVLLAMFPLMPLLLILAYVAGAFRRPSARQLNPGGGK